MLVADEDPPRRTEQGASMPSKAFKDTVHAHAQMLDLLCVGVLGVFAVAHADWGETRGSVSGMDSQARLSQLLPALESA